MWLYYIDCRITLMLPNILYAKPPKKMVSGHFSAPKIYLGILTAYIFYTILLVQKACAQIPIDPNNVYEQDTLVHAGVSEDMDGDGMPNWWELEYGFSNTNPNDAAGDADHDNLTNLQEYVYGTNPRKKDTDDGGVWDDLEIKLNKDPLYKADDFWPITFRAQPEKPDDTRGDSDGDGISNVDERKYGTDIHSIDTDDDGVNDYDEIFKFQTDPLDKDTDKDGLTDFEELSIYATNPNNRDTDFDGLTDYEEILVYSTNPTIWDTDDGGMSDGDEVNYGSNPKLKDDDYQFSWIVYYGETPNDLFKSLGNNKISIFKGMNLTLEAIKPVSAKSITFGYNGKIITFDKAFIKLNLLSPTDPGMYKIDVKIILDNGKEIVMTKFVEVQQRGSIIRMADGTFNNLYRKLSFFDPQPLFEAKVDVLVFDEITRQLIPYRSEIFPQANPIYTDSRGTYMLALHPGNYMIKVTKPEFGKKEIIYNTETFSLFSDDIYVTYNYDTYIWISIFIAVFLITRLIIFILEWLRYLVDSFIKHTIKHGHAH